MASAVGGTASRQDGVEPGACKLLLESSRGRTELSFADCPPLRQGWQLRVSGNLRRLRPAPHPLLAGPAERLAGKGVQTRLHVE
ncbi:MAG: hypothetical protein VKI63_03350, partial [Cyanobium sp.]|nr:hypothetical protein [Cyanobium sp.]